MKKLTLSTALLAALAVTGTAQAYQFEVNGGAEYAHVTTHVGHDNTEAAGVGGTATIYLKDVDSKKGPLAEAAFLNQASSISGGYNYLQGDSSTGDGKAHVLSAGGEFYVPSSMLGMGDAVTFYAAGNANRAKVESDPFNGFAFNAEVGLIPNQLSFGTLLLTAGVTGYHDNLDSELDPTFRAKLLTKFYQNDVNLEGHVQLGGDDRSNFGNKYNIIGFSGDFYADSTFSVGAGYERVLVNGEHDPFEVSFNARKFVTDNLSVQGGINFGKSTVSLTSPTNMLINSLDDNNFGAKVGATLRF